MRVIFRLIALSTVTVQLVYGSSKPSCDGSEAELLVRQIDVYNSKLDSYASLVSSSPTSPKIKLGNLLDKRVVATSKGKVNAPVKQTAEADHNKQHTPTVLKVGQTKANLIPASKPTTDKAHVHAEPSKAKVHFSTYVPIEQQRHSAMIKQGFESLAQQQTVLDSMGGICIPASHREKVISAFTKTFSLYLIHRKSLEDVSHLVARAQRQQAGWLTMGDDVNSGFNGDNAELTASTETSSTTQIWGYAYPPSGYGGYPPPQYSPEYITVTVSPSTVSAPASTDSGDDDDDDGDDSGDSSSTPVVAPPPPQPTAKHHGILYDSTIGLIVGSLHLVERILGFGGGSSNALTDLVEKVTHEYKLKL